MIVCTNCNTAQFLQITSSTAYFDHGETIHEVSENYECTLCKATGEYKWTENEGHTVDGDVEIKDEEPRWPATP